MFAFLREQEISVSLEKLRQLTPDESVTYVIEQGKQVGIFPPDVDKALTLPALEEASYEVGYDLKVKVENKTICVGSARFIEREGIVFPDAMS